MSAYPYGRARYRSRRRGQVHPGVLAAVAVAGLAAAGGGTAVHPHASAVRTAAASAQAGTAAADRALGRTLAAADGWGSGGQWTCLDMLWTRESGWLMVWNYQGSGAYGIAQALPAARMAAAGPDYMTNPGTQVRWGLGYIAGRYGTPCGAWDHEKADGWY